jgi:hypothetical protein
MNAFCNVSAVWYIEERGSSTSYSNDEFKSTMEYFGSTNLRVLEDEHVYLVVALQEFEI